MTRIAILFTAFMLIYSISAFGDDKSGSTRDEINQGVTKSVKELKKAAGKTRDEINKAADKMRKKNGKEGKKEQKDKKEKKKEEKD